MLALDDPLDDIRMPYISSWIDSHHRRESQFHRARMETTEIVRQDLWEHRDHLAWSIDTRCSCYSLAIEGGTLRHILSNIGDMDGERIVSVCLLSDRDSIIEILGI